MTDIAKNSGPDRADDASDPSQAADDAVPQLAQTLVHNEGTPSATGDVRGTKQSRDLAFAMASLQLGYANVRSLGLAVKNWTTFGKLSLADHLVATRMLSDEQRTAAERRAQRVLTDTRDASQDQTSNGAERSQSSADRERHWLNRLDPSGKITKLLGIADTSVLSQDEIEDRQLASRYTLLRKLGEGGLGVVWLARDQNLQRYVAVKEISHDVQHRNIALDHFRREAEITGRLEHPGIVPVYQYGEDAVTGSSFYVMRFLGKRTLQDAIVEYHERREAGNDDPMMLHRLLSALISVCHSVGHAHSRKVIHRDLKPENVAMDEFGQVTVIDWGLAMINDATGMYEVNGQPEPGDLHNAGSTQVGRVLGTPLYMAPEQASGRLDEVDELTDVYALGGMLYAILTGIAPHQATSSEANSESNLSAIMSMIVADKVTPPRDVLPSVPRELNAVCTKALSAKRYLRYGSATELAEEIQRYIAGTPVEAYKPPADQKVKRWMTAHPTLTQSILLAASLLLIGGAAIGFTARKGWVALQQAQYASVQEFTRELEANLNFEADGMIRNLHFVSELPLMEAIVTTHHNVDRNRQIPSNVSTSPAGQAAEASGSSDAMRIVYDDSAESLLNRQGNLYTGLLNANPAYLLACTCVKDASGLMREAVRAERIAAGRRVQRVARKRLRSAQPQDEPTPEAEILESLRPDEVLLITNDQLSENVPVDTRSPLVLSGIRAIFDREGEFFGLNIIELDLQRRLEGIFDAVAPENVMVCVTDVAGNIVLKYEQGNFNRVENIPVAEEFPQLKRLFSSTSTASEMGDGKSEFARRVQLGGSPKAQIGIVARLQER